MIGFKTKIIIDMSVFVIFCYEFVIVYVRMEHKNEVD